MNANHSSIRAFALFFPVCLTTLLSGCATPSGLRFAQSEDAQETPTADQALVFIARTPNFVGSANSWIVGLGGKDLVTVPNGGYFLFMAPPGPVRFTTRFENNPLNFGLATLFNKDRETLKLNLQAGEVYYLKLDFGGQMIALPPEEGRKALGRCKKIVEKTARNK